MQTQSHNISSAQNLVNKIELKLIFPENRLQQEHFYVLISRKWFESMTFIGCNCSNFQFFCRSYESPINHSQMNEWKLAIWCNMAACPFRTWGKQISVFRSNGYRFVATAELREFINQFHVGHFGNRYPFVMG